MGWEDHGEDLHKKGFELAQRANSDVPIGSGFSS